MQTRIRHLTDKQKQFGLITFWLLCLPGIVHTVWIVSLSTIPEDSSTFAQWAVMFMGALCALVFFRPFAGKRGRHGYPAPLVALAVIASLFGWTAAIYLLLYLQEEPFNRLVMMVVTLLGVSLALLILLISVFKFGFQALSRAGTRSVGGTTFGLTKQDTLWYTRIGAVVFLFCVVLAIPKMEEQLAGLSLKHSGTGIVVAENYILTAAHVVEGCKQITVSQGYKTTKAHTIAVSKRDDLGLLKSKRGFDVVAKFRDGKAIGIGQPVVKYGFSQEAPDGGLTVGAVTALAGRNVVGGMDTNVLDYNGMARPGTSGGPVLDQSGTVVGIHSTGRGDDCGAVKSSVAERFLAANSVGYEKAESTRILTPPVIAKEAEKYTLKVLCWGRAPLPEY